MGTQMKTYGDVRCISRLLREHSEIARMGTIRYLPLFIGRIWEKLFLDQQRLPGGTLVC